MRIVLVVLLSLLTGVAYARTVRVAASTSSPTPAEPYDTWANAFATVNAAVEYALTHDDVDEVLLQEGTHVTAGDASVLSSGQMTVDKALTIRGDAGREATIVDVGKKCRAFILKHPDAVLTGLTLQNANPTKTNTGMPSGYNGGCICIESSGGQVVDCIVRNNVLGIGGAGAGIWMGSEKGVVSHCVITNNTKSSTTRGGGIFATNGRIDNCLLIGNNANAGPNLCAAEPVAVQNCTIDGTVVQDRGNVTPANESLHGTFVNCLFLSPQMLYGAACHVTNCAATADFSTYTGSGDADLVNPIVLSRELMLFADNVYRLSEDSPLVNRGVNYAGVAETDLDGLPRVVGDSPDIGCYEVQSSAFSADFVMDTGSVLFGESVQFTSNVKNAPSGAVLSYRWVFSAPGATTFERTEANPSVSFAEGGVYTVTLTVTDTVSGRSTESFARPNCVAAYAETVKVRPPFAGADPIAPFATWEHAATNLADAVAWQRDDVTLTLRAGTYGTSETLVLTTSTAIVGLDGFSNTVVDAQEGPSPFTLDNREARLEGLTVSNAYVTTERYGGGVRIASRGGTVRACRICCNRMNAKGAGVGIYLDSDDALVDRCVIDRNRMESTNYGGVYAAKGEVRDSLIVNNYAYGGGVCLLGGQHNAQRTAVSASSTARLVNCTVTGNTTKTPGLWPAGVISRGGQILNCLIAGNVTAGYDRTRTEDGYPEWTGFAADGSDSAATVAAMTNCAFNVEFGAGGLNPKSGRLADFFRNAAADDYRPTIRSVTRNAGYDFGMYTRESRDVIGNPRLSGGGVDIGAFEYQDRGLLLLVK